MEVVTDTTVVSRSSRYSWHSRYSWPSCPLYLLLRDTTVSFTAHKSAL